MVVIDNSALLDGILGAEPTARLDEIMAEETLHAPALVDFEFLSSVRGLLLGGRLPEAEVPLVLQDFDDLAIERWPASPEHQVRILSLRHNLTAYDAAYVALAEVLDCPLITRDAPLSRSTGHHATIELV